MEPSFSVLPAPCPLLLPPVAPQVVVLIGPVRSGKTNELVRHYRAALDGASPKSLNRAIWLAPNGRTAAAVRERLVLNGLSASLRPGVFTFDDLTRQIVIATNARLKRLDSVLERDLLRRVVAQAIKASSLSFFAESASRPGFIDLLAEHIAELKRRDIRPDAYASATSRRADDEPHRELAQLYSDYETLLSTHNLVDAESAHTAARNAPAQKACRRFENLKLIVADGFTDFTRTQFEIIDLLAQRANQLFISLPGDNGPPFAATRSASGADRAPASHSLSLLVSPPNEIASRPDLFAKTAATLCDLQHHFPNLQVRQLEARPLPCPAIDHVAQQVFRNPKHVAAPTANVLASLSQIEIVEAAGAQDEVIQIARRVKALLTASPPKTPTRPGDILVVFRSLTEVAPRIREVFDCFGIPCFLDAAPPVATASVIKTLFDLLLLDQEDWRFRRVVSILTNNTIRACDDDSRRAADWLVRDLQIASGRSALLDRVQTLATDPSDPSDRSDHLQRRVAAATVALPALVRLANVLDALPDKTTPTQWCEALSRLGANLALPPFVDESAGWHALRLGEGRGGAVEDPRPSKTLGVPPSDDPAAWHFLVAKFAALEHLDSWLGGPPRELSRRELLTTLRDVTTHESLPRTHADAGRVRILAAPAARNISARHLFLAGMSEQAFPSAERPGRLTSDAEYQRLERAAHQPTLSATRAAATRAQAEMLLFYELLGRAEESLTISYPALDDKAQSLPPSPYVVELERVLGSEALSRIRRAKPQLSPVAPAATPYSIPDCRIQAVARATGKEADRRLLAGIFACPETKPLADAIDAGLRIVHVRAHGESFGPAEGLLTSPAIAARLAQRFGPQHAWSASQWETYATCPFRFFMEVVLGLEPLGDLVLETDFARRGSRLHDVLATFHRQWLTVRREHPLAPDDEAAAFFARLQHVINERTSSTAHVGIDAALLELDRRQILHWANRHFQNQSKYNAACAKMDVAMTPAHFEFRFGSARQSDSPNDPDSTAKPFILDLKSEQVRVTGQIDRIDVGTVGGKQVFNVIDYKSGRRASLKQDQLETGQQLQLPIYVEAAQVLVFHNDAEPLAAGYWGMASGFDAKGALAQRSDDNRSRWSETQTQVHQLVRQFIDSIRRGDFPVASRDDNCTSHCNFSTICRVSQARNLNKTWWPEHQSSNIDHPTSNT